MKLTETLAHCPFGAGNVSWSQHGGHDSGRDCAEDSTIGPIHEHRLVRDLRDSQP
jgi:hypothetical protein